MPWRMLKDGIFKWKNYMNKENKLVLYKDDEGNVNVNVRFADEDVWLTQQQ